jgi:hypothetical protein
MLIKPINNIYTKIFGTQNSMYCVGSCDNWIVNKILCITDIPPLDAVLWTCKITDPKNSHAILNYKEITCTSNDPDPNKFCTLIYSIDNVPDIEIMTLFGRC